MRRAILVMATSVAFLVSGAAFAVTGSRTATITSAADLVTKGTLTNAAGELIVESAKSGLYIPAGATASTEVAVATKTAGTIAKAAVGTAVKAAARANGAIFAAQGAIAAATAAVDWLQKDGSYVKKSDGSSSPQIKWLYDGNSSTFTSARSACDAFQASQAAYDSSVQVVRFEADTSNTYKCTIANESGSIYTSRSIYQSVSCASPSYLDTTTGRCVGGEAGYVSLTEQDYNDLGDWVQQQDGTFVRQAAIEGCYLAANPDSCFESVVPDRKLTGPSVVTGAPTTTSKTVTTTDASGNVTTGTSTTTTTPAAKVTYNNNTTNNVTYNTYNQTTTKNPDGSETETTTDEGTPDVPDLLTPSLKPLQDLPDMIKGQGSEGSSVPYTSWFDLGGGKCSEIVIELPVVGTVHSTFCDMYYKFVHPALYFLFSVWTWHTCFQIFRESATRVRAK